MITQRAKWTELLLEENKGHIAETPQAPLKEHLPHLLLKMFDSRRFLVQMAFLCSAVVWSCCGNILSFWNPSTRQTDVYKKKKKGAEKDSFKHTSDIALCFNKAPFQTGEMCHFGQDVKQLSAALSCSVLRHHMSQAFNLNNSVSNIQYVALKSSGWYHSFQDLSLSPWGISIRTQVPEREDVHFSKVLPCFC